MMEFEELMDKKELYSFVATRTSQCRILVAGDVMLDKYYYSEVTRISRKPPFRSRTCDRKWKRWEAQQTWRTI